MQISITDNQQIVTTQFNRGLQGFSLGVGGMVNFNTGHGTGLDKSQNNFFNPTRVTSRTELEVLYNESWACKKFIDIPIDDMFIRPRMFKDMDEKAVDAIVEQQKKYQVLSRLSRAMKAGRLYGTAAILIITKESTLDKPFNIEKMRPNDLVNLLVVDRFDLSVSGRIQDVSSIDYGLPEEYNVNIIGGGTFKIHASRVLRFDGMQSLSMTGWITYDKDWGVSEIIPVLTSIYQDSALAGGIAHLTQETSIPVVKIADFQDAITGSADADMTLGDRASAVSNAKSIYRTIYMDKEDEFERHDVTWTGLPDLMDRYSKRLAAAADIPATRFHGQSPLGMNATGEGDADNYALHVAAMQNKLLTDPLERLDKILMRNAGIEEKVEYTFPALIDMSEKDKAEIAFKKMDTAVKGVTAGIIDENEGREILDGDEIIGNLEELSDNFFEKEDEPSDDDKELKEFLKKSAAAMVKNGEQE